MAEPTIVAFRLRQLGDVLATLGALEAVKAHWPDGRLVYAVDARYHRLLAGTAFIDELIDSPPRATGRAGVAAFVRYVARLRRMRAAAVLDFHGNARSALVTALSGARVRVGFDVRVRRRVYTHVEPRAVYENGLVKPRTSLQSALSLVAHLGVAAPARPVPAALAVDEASVQRARGRLVAAGVPTRALEDGTVVGLNPGLPYPAKAWSQERFATLAGRLIERGRHVVVLWGPGEEAAAWAIAAQAGAGASVAPPSDIDELPGIVRSLSLVVTIDSGLKHLAVCVGVPTVTLFGSTDPREWHVATDRDTHLWRGLSCSPCRRRECPFGAPCMDIQPSEVLAAIDAVEGVGTR